MLTVDGAELSTFIAQQTGHSGELIDSILDSELEFLDLKGLLTDSPEENDSEESIFIDTDELKAFIIEKLGLSVEVVTEVLEAEDEFLISKGIMEEKQTEF